MTIEYGAVNWKFEGDGATGYVRFARKFLGWLKDQKQNRGGEYIKESRVLPDGTIVIGEYIGNYPTCKIITPAEKQDSFLLCKLDHGLFKTTRTFPDGHPEDKYEYFIDNGITQLKDKDNKPTLPYELEIPTDPWSIEWYCSTYPVKFMDPEGKKIKVNNKPVRNSKEKPCNDYLICATENKNFNGLEVGKDNWIFVDDNDVPWIVTIKFEVDEFGKKRIAAYLRGIFEFFKGGSINDQLLINKLIGYKNISNRHGVPGYPEHPNNFYPDYDFYSYTFCTNRDMFQSTDNKQIVCNIRVQMYEKWKLRYTTDLVEVIAGIFTGIGETQKYITEGNEKKVNPKFGEGLSLTFTINKALDDVYHMYNNKGLTGGYDNWGFSYNVSAGGVFMFDEGEGVPTEHIHFTSIMNGWVETVNGDTNGTQSTGFKAYHFAYFNKTTLSYIIWEANKYFTLADATSNVSGVSTVSGHSRLSCLPEDPNECDFKYCQWHQDTIETGQITAKIVTLPMQGYIMDCKLTVGGAVVHTRTVNDYQYAWESARYYNAHNNCWSPVLIQGSEEHYSDSQHYATIDDKVLGEGDWPSEWNLYTVNNFNNGFITIGGPQNKLFTVTGEVLDQNVSDDTRYYTIDPIGERKFNHSWPITYADRLKIKTL